METTVFPADIFAWRGIVLCTAVYLLHVVSRVFELARKEERRHTLQLRHLKSSSSKMVGGSEQSSAFIDELMIEADVILPVIDYAVMRALDGKYPLLVKQEHLHAKMHHQGVRERNDKGGEERWQWLLRIGRKLLLKSGEQLSYGCTGNVETVGALAFYYSAKSPFTSGYMSNEFLYHVMEEVEHGQLTSQFLRTKAWTLTPLFTFPLMLVVYFVLLLLPPVVALIHKPWLLHRQSTYVDIARYYLTFGPTYVAINILALFYWVLPFRESSEGHASRLEYFKAMVKRRGIEFDVVDEDTYMVPA